MNYGPINKYHISPFEVAYMIESGKMSCVKVITQFLCTNLLCLMFLTFEDCCGFIYSDSSQTDRFFHFAQVSELFSVSLRLHITPVEVSLLEGAGGCGVARWLRYRVNSVLHVS